MYFTPYICGLWDFFTICTKGDSGSEMHFISFLWIVDIYIAQKLSKHFIFQGGEGRL